MTGPDIYLSADQALPFGMAIHELLTNAAKYGALSVETGVIFINSFIDIKDDVKIARIEWRESGGPKIKKAPKTRGFGSVIIERVMKEDLNAEVEIAYKEDGLTARISFEAAQPDTSAHSKVHQLLPTDRVDV